MQPVETKILLRAIKRIPLVNGDVLRAIKTSDDGYNGFGEAYFSYIKYKAIKAWKLHTRYTANFICPMGKVKVVLYKEPIKGTLVANCPQEFILTEHEEHYSCLTIPPGIWYGFAGLGEPTNLIFSLLNGEHSVDEQQTMSIEDLPYSWLL